MKKMLVMLVAIASFAIAENCFWKETVKDVAYENFWNSTGDRTIQVHCINGKKFYSYDIDYQFTLPYPDANFDCNCSKVTK